MDIVTNYDIWGFGGVGKTELVFEFARQQMNKRNVFFVRLVLVYK